MALGNGREFDDGILSDDQASHDDEAARSPVLGEHCPLPDQTAGVAYPTATSRCVIKTTLWRRRWISEASAVSKNSSSASARLRRASSTVLPWPAMSNSGQRATQPSPSRSMMAINSDEVASSSAPHPTASFSTTRSNTVSARWRASSRVRGWMGCSTRTTLNADRPSATAENAGLLQG